MPNEYEYLCTRCNRITERDMLTVKKTIFVSMGEGSKTSRARVRDWLCPECVAADTEWNLPKNLHPARRLSMRPKVGVEE